MCTNGKIQHYFAPARGKNQFHVTAALWFNHRCIWFNVMKHATRVCFSCCAVIWATLVFAYLLTHGRVIHDPHIRVGASIYMATSHDELGSEVFVTSTVPPSSSSYPIRPLAVTEKKWDPTSEENWDQNFKCFDKSTLSLTLSFDVGWTALDQHIGLLHGFALAYFLGAKTIVEPRLRFGLNEESSHRNNMNAQSESTPSGSAKEISLQHLYDGAQINEALRQLDMVLLPEPARNIETVNLELHINTAGEPIRAICSKVREVVMPKKSTHFLLRLGLAAGLLRVDELNLGLISFIDRHLQYNEGIQMATQFFLSKLPTAFNGLHISHETSKTWRTELPKKVVPRLMELGFELNTTIFVASEVPSSVDRNNGLRWCFRCFLSLGIRLNHV